MTSHERASTAATSLGSWLALILAPKCPLCVAALLSSFGVSAAGASLVAPLVRPLLVVAAITAMLAFVLVEVRAHRRPHTTNDCCVARRASRRGRTFRAILSE